MGIKIVCQPPYSPDLAPCDFWLFPKLTGCRYETIEEMKEAVMKVIDTLIQEDFHGAFQKFWNGTASALQPEISSKGTRVSCVYCHLVKTFTIWNASISLSNNILYCKIFDSYIYIYTSSALLFLPGRTWLHCEVLFQGFVKNSTLNYLVVPM